MWFVQLWLVNDNTYYGNNLLVRKANTIMKSTECPSENIKEGVVKINTEKTTQIMPYLPQGH